MEEGWAVEKFHIEYQQRSMPCASRVAMPKESQASGLNPTALEAIALATSGCSIQFLETQYEDKSLALVDKFRGIGIQEFCELACDGKYAKAVLKFAKLNTVAQQREAVIRGRSLLPYRLRYIYRSIAAIREVGLRRRFQACRCRVSCQMLLIKFSWKDSCKWMILGKRLSKYQASTIFKNTHDTE
jgi:hypothetical protein